MNQALVDEALRRLVADQQASNEAVRRILSADAAGIRKQVIAYFETSGDVDARVRDLGSVLGMSRFGRPNGGG